MSPLRDFVLCLPIPYSREAVSFFAASAFGTSRRPGKTHMKERFDLRFLIADIGAYPILQDPGPPEKSR